MGDYVWITEQVILSDLKMRISDSPGEGCITHHSSVFCSIAINARASLAGCLRTQQGSLHFYRRSHLMLMLIFNLVKVNQA